MSLVWNDDKSFKQHLENMRMFHQTHRNDEGRLAPHKDMPKPVNVRPPSKAGGTRGTISINGGAVTAPIWQITPPKNSQN